nr:hypothetical protein [Tanacetum cinerariifolium]
MTHIPLRAILGVLQLCTSKNKGQPFVLVGSTKYLVLSFSSEARGFIFFAVYLRIPCSPHRLYANEHSEVLFVRHRRLCSSREMRVTRPMTHIPLRAILGVLQLCTSKNKGQPFVLVGSTKYLVLSFSSEARGFIFFAVYLRIPCSPHRLYANEHSEVLFVRHRRLCSSREMRLEALCWRPDTATFKADDDDEEEEHSASADSIPPPPALRVTNRISFRPQPPTLSFTKEDAERFLAMPIPPPSPLTPLSSPLPQIPSPLLPASPPILPIPLPTASPPLQLLSSDRESSAAAAARPIEGRRTDYGFVGSVEAEIRRRIAEDIGYGIRDAWIDPRDADGDVPESRDIGRR